MLKTKTWIIILSIIVLICIILSLIIFKNNPEQNMVEVVQDGEVIKEIDLSEHKEEYSFTVDANDGGYNVVSVEDGKIRITDADCPDKVCVHHDWLLNNNAPIICLPHKLIIRFKEGGNVDAVVK